MRGIALLGLLVGCVGGNEADTSCLDCGVQVGGEPGDVTDTCGEPVESTAAMSDLVLDGHSGDEAMALLAGPAVYTPTWWDGRTATLTLTGEAVGDTVTVIDLPDGDEHCWRRIEFDATFRFVSSDGAFDETWVQRITWSDPWNSEDLSIQVPIGELTGSLDTTSIAADATQLIGFLRVGGDRGDLGYLELSSPGAGEGGSEDVRTRFVVWGDVDLTEPDDTGDTGA